MDGKPGFRYNGLKAFITLEDFIVLLSKVTIMNLNFKTTEWWNEIKKPFIKDYIHLKNKSGGYKNMNVWITGENGKLF